MILSGSALRTPSMLNAAPLNARWEGKDATGYEWLSRDPAVWKAFDDDPLTVTSDYIGSIDLEADGTSKSGASGRYELYFGGPSLGSASIDLSGDKPAISWD